MKGADRWDIALLLYSMVGVFFTLAAALGLLTIGLMAWIRSESDLALAAQGMTAALLTMALMGIPALFMAVRRIFFNSPPITDIPSPRWYGLAALLPLGLALGWIGYEMDIAPWLLGPLGQVLAVGAPAGLVVVHMRRMGPPIRDRRAWGHFLLGLWAVPFVTIVLEGFLLLGAVVLGVLGLSLTPAGRPLLAELQQLATSSGAAMTELPAGLMSELARSPVIIMVLVGLLGIAVPITEETLKTASVWPLLRDRFSSGEAFLGGALGGTGFALSEALFLTQPAAGWLVTAVARSGATLMHALATAIAAWGLAEGLKRHKWFRALAAWILAMSVHGLWNVSAIAVGLSQLGASPGTSLTGSNAAIASVGLVVIVGLSLLALFLLPRLQMRASKAGEAAPQAIR